jgi:hypothetical protein
MKTVRKTAGLIVCTCLAWAAPASADPVVDWNTITFQVLAAAPPSSRPGPSAILDVAIVHIAVHDAVQAFERRFEPYHVHFNHQDVAGSPVAAVAKAARDVLVARFPLQTASIDQKYTDYLAARGLTNDSGRFVGQAAAAGILALRANDGSFPPVCPTTGATPGCFPAFNGGTAAGEWRPALPALATMAAPWLGAVDPFTKKFSEQFRAAPPPPLTSNDYARAYNEVKALGGSTSGCLAPGQLNCRTPEQTDLANFYNDNLVALWHRTLRSIALAQLPLRPLGDSARLFALASIASADAIITAWDSKLFYDLWRPITAIREGSNDGNPKTAGDTAWLSFIPTPPYPDYTSGANNLSGSMTRTLELYFQTDQMTFSVTSGNANAVLNPRTYERFSAVADDMVDVRIYQGIHFRFADTAARRQGTRVTNQAFKHFLRPLHDKDDDDDGDDDGDRGGDRRE